MSKAFTKDDADTTELVVAPRPPLPQGVPNYVTARGLAALQAELSSIVAQRAAVERADLADRVLQLHALTQRLNELHSRLGSAVVIETGGHAPDRVRFGCIVRVRHESGSEEQYQIVGVDEADAASGKIAFCAPLARALLGKRAGDSLEFRAPRGTVEMELLSVVYDEIT